MGPRQEARAWRVAKVSRRTQPYLAERSILQYRTKKWAFVRGKCEGSQRKVDEGVEAWRTVWRYVTVVANRCGREEVQWYSWRRWRWNDSTWAQSLRWPSQSPSTGARGHYLPYASLTRARVAKEVDEANDSGCSNAGEWAKWFDYAHPLEHVSVELGGWWKRRGSWRLARCGCHSWWLLPSFVDAN